jgi:acetyl esterase
MRADCTYKIEDRDYLSHGGKALAMRIFRPEGAGPFPAVIDLHGGAWSKGDLAECHARDAVLARRGIIAIAIDFRQGSDGYPSALVDINYAVRWVKANAEALGTRADLVSMTGQSSGGHLAMLVAMRPNDPRYAAIPLPAGSPMVDASVRAVVMTWPVINPLSRLRHLQRHMAAGTIPEQYAGIAERQSSFWQNDANMIDGNPMLILERGETTAPLPPTLWIQSRPDFMHDYRDPDSPIDANEPERFAATYREAGGRISITDIPQDARNAESTHELVAHFLLEQLPKAVAA